MSTPETEQELFDLEKVHDEQIYPLVEKLIAICQEHKIPALISFNYANVKVDEENDPRASTTFLAWPERSPLQFQVAFRDIRSNPHFMAFTITKRGAKEGGDGSPR